MHPYKNNKSIFHFLAWHTDSIVIRYENLKIANVQFHGKNSESKIVN